MLLYRRNPLRVSSTPWTLKEYTHLEIAVAMGKKPPRSGIHLGHPSSTLHQRSVRIVVWIFPRVLPSPEVPEVFLRLRVLVDRKQPVDS